MLTKLCISNFSIIDKIELHLSKGLTIITGETGAGKSLFINALGFISGKRADTSFLFDKREKSVIEAHFSSISKNLLKQYKGDQESSLILRREIYPNGKSRSFINNNPVSLGRFGELVKKLIDIHGQQDHQLIKDNLYQLKFLDVYCENEKLLEKYQHCFEKYQSVKKQVCLLEEQQKNQLKDQQFNHFLLQELESAKIVCDEEKELYKEACQLEHAQEIRKWLSEGIYLLDHEESGVLSQLVRLKNSLEKSSGLLRSHYEWVKRTHATWIEMSDLYNEMLPLIETIESKPQRLEIIHQRLNLLNRLQKKYQVTSGEELLKIQEKFQKISRKKENVSLDLEALRDQECVLRDNLEKRCRKISEQRKKKIPDLERILLSLLRMLEMPQARLKIELSGSKDLHTMGAEDIKILFSANKGLPLKGIRDTASGGERSRLTLAMKSLGEVQQYTSSLILDEIDTGVSGKTADKVGYLLKEMARKRQIIVITHLPQVAAKGEKHLKAYKTEVRSRATIFLRELSEKERIEEIAQMISGTTVTQAARLQAQVLLSS